MARALGARATMAAAFESTYGTAPGSGFFTMPFATSNLGADQPLIESEILGQGRDPIDPIRDAVTVDGSASVPVDQEAFGMWLKGAFGDPTTTGTGPYTHRFDSGKWALPSMAIEVGHPQVPAFNMYAGAVVNTIGWSMQRSGLLSAEIGLIAQSETKNTTTQAGTPTGFTFARFGHFQGSVKRDTVTLGNIVSAEITYSNNLDRVEVIRSDGLIEGLDPSLARLSGRVTARFDSTALYDQAVNGTASELDFGYVAGANSLNFVAHRVFLPRARIPIQGPQGVQVDFEWEAAFDATATRMATVTLINNVASY